MGATLPEEFERYPLRTSRGGHFWIAGERVETPDGQHVQRAPLYVQWEAPAEITKPYPLVLVHGGGGQLTDWLGTPDGRPGWFSRLVDEGYETARKILTEKKAEFEKLAQALLEYETLSGDEIRDLIAGKEIIRREDDDSTPSRGSAVPSAGKPHRKPPTPDTGLEPTPQPQ